jgi:hypothetical protein
MFEDVIEDLTCTSAHLFLARQGWVIDYELFQIAEKHGRPYEEAKTLSLVLFEAAVYSILFRKYL